MLKFCLFIFFLSFVTSAIADFTLDLYMKIRQYLFPSVPLIDFSNIYPQDINAPVDYIQYKCPSCDTSTLGHYLDEDLEPIVRHFKFCSCCGKRLHWNKIIDNEKTL